MAGVKYAKGLEELAAGTIDWENDPIKCMLVKSGYAPDAAADEFLADVQAHRFSGTTDQTLNGRTIARDTGNTRIELQASGCTFASVPVATGGAAHGVVIYKSVDSAGASPLLVFDDASNAVSDGNNIDYDPSGEGNLQFPYG